MTCALKRVARTDPSYGRRHAFRCHATESTYKMQIQTTRAEFFTVFCNFPTAKRPQRVKTAKIRERGERDPIALPRTPLRLGRLSGSPKVNTV